MNDASTTYTYDQAGRLVTMAGAKNATYEWDGADHLVWANENGADVSYLYDSSGRMLSRTQNEEETDTYSVFLPYGTSQEAGEVYEWDEGETLALKYSYVSDSSGTRLAQTDALANATTYPFRDPRGDVLDLASTSGAIAAAYAYTPFGELQDGFAQFQGANKETGTPFLYQDDYLDPATELYQMQARWYDPSTARFLSLDPKMGDASDPLRRLPYAYCAGDPVFNSDPTGMDFFSRMMERAAERNSTSTVNSSGETSTNEGEGGDRSINTKRVDNKSGRITIHVPSFEEFLASVPEGVRDQLRKALKGSAQADIIKTVNNFELQEGDEVYLIKIPKGPWTTVEGCAPYENDHFAGRMPISTNTQDYVEGGIDLLIEQMPEGGMKNVVQALEEIHDKLGDIFSIAPIKLNLDSYIGNSYQAHEYDLQARVIGKDGDMRNYTVATGLVDISYTYMQRTEVLFESQFSFYTKTWGRIHGGPDQTNINYVYNAVPGAHYRPDNNDPAGITYTQGNIDHGNDDG